MDQAFPITDKAIVKPWGYEEILYQTCDIAIWHLYLKYQHSTSLHCHPNKRTGIIFLNYPAQFHFLNSVQHIFGFSKFVIHRGVFHRTLSLNFDGIHVLETETPNEKLDLVRIKDNYGRDHNIYETEYRKRDYPLFNHSGVGLDLSYKYIYSFSLFNGFTGNFDLSKINEIKTNDIVIIIKGGISYKDFDIAKTGDIIWGKDLIFLSREYNLDIHSEFLIVVNSSYSDFCIRQSV